MRSTLNVPASTIDPLGSRRRWPRRLAKLAIFLFGGLAILWTATLTLATIDKNRAVAKLKKLGHPTTLDEVLAIMKAKAGSTTSVELVRQAIEANNQLGRPGDGYSLAGGWIDTIDDEAQRARLAEGVRQSDFIIQLLDKAMTSAPGVGTRMTPGGSRNYEPCHDIRSLGRLVVLPLKSADDHGEHDRVVHLLGVSFGLGELLSADEFVIPQLVRLALHGVASSCFRRTAPSLILNQERFETLDRLLVSIEQRLTFHQTLINERAAVASLFENPEALREELRVHLNNPTPTPTWNQQAVGFAQHRWVELLSTPVGLPARRRATADTLSCPGELLEHVDVPPPWPNELTRLQSQWKCAFDPNRLLFSGGDSSHSSNLYYAALRTRRRFALMRLALRVKWHRQQHGRLPNRLEEVCDAAMKDPPTKWFEGKPFTYTKHGRSFRIEGELSALDEPFHRLLDGLDALPGARQERRDDMRFSWGLAIKLDLKETDATPMAK